MFGTQVQEPVDAGHEHARVTVLLPPDGKYVEEYGPDQVVHGHAEVCEPVGHRVVCIARCRVYLDRESCDLEAARSLERDGGSHIARTVGGVGSVAVPQTEADVFDRVGAILRQEDGELFDEAAQVGGGDEPSGPLQIPVDADVTVDRQLPAHLVECCRGPSDVVEVRQQDGGERCVTHGAEFGEGACHLFLRLAGVDADDALGCEYEALVR